MFLNKRITIETACIFYMLFFSITIFAQEPADFVNPFIGTSNYGATFPGPIAPRGMASISPFNVAGKQNKLEKDSQWLSNPYVNENTFLTGFSQVNISGVGCPELGVLIVMPTTGAVETNHLKYGSTYKNEVAKAAYYSVDIDKYNVKAEFTASKRVGVSKFTFPKGQSNILLNLGLGLTNEEGAMVKVVSPSEIEGMRSVGSFCYNSPEDAYPVYFVAKFSKPANKFGVWKKPSKYEGTEAQWMTYNGKTRMMDNTIKTVVGDSIGTYFTYKFDKQETVEVKIGISYVSIANARENLEKETGNKSFEAVYKDTYKEWNEELSKILVEGGSEDDKTIFYTALYHTLIHPNTLNDVNGEYPKIKRTKIGKTDGTRYTVFSLWDTYRNMHPLTSLVYPKQQSDMIKSMLEMYDENGWLPKWELNSTETFTMVGDPSSIVIVDALLKGIQDFDFYKAYHAMVQAADQIEENPLRPGLKEYIGKGYLSTNYPGPVSTTLEYNTSDHAISLLAKALGEKEDYKRFTKRSLSYQKLYDKDLKLLRPRTANGKWYEPFDPEAGANFQENVGFIEGNAWQYAFMVPHDIVGLKKLMGGDKAFSDQLQKVFDIKQFDMANEPDIAYPYLFNYVKGEEYKSQEMVKKLVNEYFQNKPNGLPGNDDTGTMSAWLVYSMMGIYPISPGDPIYTITAPMFHRITIKLDPRYYKKESIVIERQINNDGKINSIEINGKPLNSFFISHEDFVNGTKLKVIQN
ncbi:GH92 family glycosyl hydrolase [Flavobacterium sp. ANB]|uniref:GH92 family glycosyl hydrolase n=1 Tax=unclassified Flavobacterium TaxID=196869 RepID=UPI0012B91CB7|nr:MULTISPECIES: GH92 family glycosyl hydrolase [unclassified Flavobacterium]MBF4516089.1 GH92 family glycosyl hydrolase [Flavobacterium sp. ANB]MTD72186.1 glycoside hydrolase family 92 protein [Flavobacterium sp. LC2016-13]